MMAASHAAIARSSSRMIPAVIAPAPSSAMVAAPPKSPAPLQACLPFSVSSARASSISCRISVEVSSESFEKSSPIERSRRPVSCSVTARLRASACAAGRRPPAGRAGRRPRRARAGAGAGAAGGGGGGGRERVGQTGLADGRGPAGGRQLTIDARALLVAAAARGLQHARGGEPEREPAGGDRPRLAAGEVLDVAQDPVGVRLLQPRARALDAVGRLIGDLRRPLLALLAQLPRDVAQVGGVLVDLLAGLRGALVDLLAHPVAGLSGGLSYLLARLIADLLRLLLCLLLDAVSTVRGGGSAGVGGSCHCRSFSSRCRVGQRYPCERAGPRPRPEDGALPQVSGAAGARRARGATSAAGAARARRARRRASCAAPRRRPGRRGAASPPGGRGASCEGTSAHLHYGP